ncbi:hypothetical protein [Absidia glauca]|uniref:Uncharacterized protein n=1 Tax=Absidia glauca TaxID=4829 RepID=A0A168S8W6_ABSGL|nr:hypothetical protein [Absidia glauca]
MPWERRSSVVKGKLVSLIRNTGSLEESEGKPWTVNPSKGDALVTVEVHDFFRAEENFGQDLLTVLVGLQSSTVSYMDMVPGSGFKLCWG